MTLICFSQFFIKTYAIHSILRKHIDVTYRVETALLEVHTAIDRRRNIPQSHLDIRTAEWQEKFELRLVSFRTYDLCCFFFPKKVFPLTLRYPERFNASLLSVNSSRSVGS